MEGGELPQIHSVHTRSMLEETKEIGTVGEFIIVENIFFIYFGLKGIKQSVLINTARD